MIKVDVKKDNIVTNSAKFESLDLANEFANQFDLNEYVVEINENYIDQEKINQDALDYLASTDWMVIKAMELSLELDATVKQLRQEARARVQR